MKHRKLILFLFFLLIVVVIPFVVYRSYPSQVQLLIERNYPQLAEIFKPPYWGYIVTVGFVLSSLLALLILVLIYKATKQYIGEV